MKKIGLILVGLILVSSVAWASDYVYIIPSRYRYPSIFYSYDYNYRTQGDSYYNPYMSQRGFYIPPIYHFLDDDDDSGILIDPYGGMWFYYNP